MNLLRLTIALVALAASNKARASDDVDKAREPMASSTISALRRVGPVEVDETRRCQFGAGGGYGFTESVLGQDDAHHRFAASLIGEVALHPAMALGLRFSGRYDRHSSSKPGQREEIDDGWTGEPQLHVRGDLAIGPRTAAGLGFFLRLPGGDAPSIEPAAISGDLIASLRHELAPFAAIAQLGYRLDRTDNATLPRARLSPGDRVGLGVNQANAILIGVAGERVSSLADFFVEASVEALHGHGSPPFAVWPMRVGVGARRRLDEQGLPLVAELLIEVSPSSRPSLGPEAPLVDLPPRLGLWLGLTWGTTPPSPPTALVPPPAPAAFPKPSLPMPSETGQLRCSIRSFGGTGIPASIRIESGPSTGSHHLAGDDGSLTLDLAPGRYEISIEAPGYLVQRRSIVIEQNGVTLLNADLREDRQRR